MNKKLFVIKVRKNELEDGVVLPRHPEFALMRANSDNTWEVENLSTKEKVIIQRVEKGDFYEYEVEKTSELG